MGQIQDIKGAMSLPVWKLQGWWRPLPAAPSQRALSSWTPRPVRTGSSGSRLEIALLLTSVHIQEVESREYMTYNSESHDEL